jgi:hypothetical protein
MRTRAIVVALGIVVATDLALCGALLLRSRACCAQQLDRVESGQLVVLLYGTDPFDQQARLAETERLLRLEPSARAFCAGGARPERGMFHCRAVVEQLAERGIDRSRLSADATSFDTRGNLIAAFNAVGANGAPLIVSDALQLLRVRRIAAAVAPGRPYHTSATPQAGGLHLVARLHWEIGAWLGALLPDRVRSALIGLTRS